MTKSKDTYKDKTCTGTNFNYSIYNNNLQIITKHAYTVFFYTRTKNQTQSKNTNLPKNLKFTQNSKI